jgi:hypothetical protein
MTANYSMAAVDAALDRLDVVLDTGGGAPLREPEGGEPLWEVPEQSALPGYWCAGRPDG